ncbi:MAG: hypothetical protein ACREB9_03180 [Thermoplasmata archaeon]
MWFEYSSAWPCLVPGGVLASDDVTWNDAFATFARGQNCHPRYLPLRYYFARKYAHQRTLPYRGWIQRPV